MAELSTTRRGAITLLGAAIGVSSGLSVGLSSTARAATTAMIEKNNRNPALRGEGEHALASSELLDEMNVSVGDQVRVGTANNNADYESALYTVVGESSSRGTVDMSKSALDRLGLKKDTAGFGRGYATHPEYETRDAADANDEYVEILVDDGKQADLVACAVHGGWIEYRTDKQSEYVANALDATEWSCVGYNSGGGAYDRWHITSTDISPGSFPGLARISDRQFTYAVSFHGFSDNGVGIGGGAQTSLKEDIRDAIDAATNGRYEVYLLSDGDYDGDSPENFVNWLTPDDNGIQIEQGWDARVNDWEPIADAVAGVYSGIV